MKQSINNVEVVDFIARPTNFNPPIDPREDYDEYVALIAITYKDGSREEIYRSPDYHPTLHAAVWDAAKIWRTVYAKGAPTNPNTPLREEIEDIREEIKDSIAVLKRMNNQNKGGKE